jgi:hypothetical protein
MGAPKGRAGGNAGKGRPKGVPNKLNRDIKEMILGALSVLGGEKYLVEQGRANPVAFMTLLGKVLPLQLQGNRESPIEVNVDPEERARRAREEIDRAFPEREAQEEEPSVKEPRIVPPATISLEGRQRQPQPFSPVSPPSFPVRRRRSPSYRGGWAG